MANFDKEVKKMTHTKLVRTLIDEVIKYARAPLHSAEESLSEERIQSLQWEIEKRLIKG